MSNQPTSLPPAERARNIARRVLHDGYDPLLASRELAGLSRHLEAVPADVRDDFEGVASECDDLPLGHERMNWSLAALAEKDKEAQHYRERVGPVIAKACQALLNALESGSVEPD